MIKKNIKCLGACDIGKSILVKTIYKDLLLNPIYNNARNVISDLGINYVFKT